VPLTVAAIGLGIAANVAAGGGFGVIVWNIHRAVDWVYLRIVGSRRVSLIESPARTAARSCSCARGTCSTRALSRMRTRTWRSC
jgi:hypothetical protein